MYLPEARVQMSTPLGVRKMGGGFPAAELHLLVVRRLVVRRRLLLVRGLRRVDDVRPEAVGRVVRVGARPGEVGLLGGVRTAGAREGVPVFVEEGFDLLHRGDVDLLVVVEGFVLGAAFALTLLGGSLRRFPLAPPETDTPCRLGLAISKRPTARPPPTRASHGALRETQDRVAGKRYRRITTTRITIAMLRLFMARGVSF
jgi:hypothetical protein